MPYLRFPKSMAPTRSPHFGHLVFLIIIKKTKTQPTMTAVWMHAKRRPVVELCVTIRSVPATKAHPSNAFALRLPRYSRSVIGKYYGLHADGTIDRARYACPIHSRNRLFMGVYAPQPPHIRSDNGAIVVEKWERHPPAPGNVRKAIGRCITWLFDRQGHTRYGAKLCFAQNALLNWSARTES
jgi:hypothetical protein